MSTLRCSVTLAVAVLLCVAASLEVQAQSPGKTKTHTLKAGQVLDLILLNNQPNADSVRKAFFTSAFSVAKRMGYAPLPGFRVLGPALAGNYQPQAAVFGTWPSLSARADALDTLELTVPRFHAMRRESWSNFNMTYWEVPREMTVTYRPEQHHVVTAYWAEDKAALKRFTDKTQAVIIAAGGEERLVLHEGSSPFGYRYAPDYLAITAWPSEAAYRAALASLPIPNAEVLSHVNQFAIQ